MVQTPAVMSQTGKINTQQKATFNQLRLESVEPQQQQQLQFPALIIYTRHMFVELFHTVKKQGKTIFLYKRNRSHPAKIVFISLCK